jgi:hypothetical protein
MARFNDGAMHHKWWDGHNWGGWESLGGVFAAGNPSCISRSVNSLDCFARGNDGAMYHKWWDGKNWYGWESLGGVFSTADPNCVVRGANSHLDCFARGNDGALYHKWTEGNQWKGWENLGGILTSNPSCVPLGNNGLDCFARATDNSLYHRRWNGTQWLAWEPLGQTLTSEPTCATLGPQSIDCAVRVTDNSLYHRRWNGTQWLTWEPLAGGLASTPSCVSYANRLDCFAQGPDRNAYHRWWTGTQWLGWEMLTPLVIKPSPDLPGRFDLAKNPAFPEFDDNGFRLNPLWRGQLANPNDLPDIEDGVDNHCGGNATTQPWEAPCTSQHTSDDSTGIGEDALELIGNWTHLHRGSCGSGHHNWMPVTYTGQLFWESHSSSHSDDDYNIRLITPSVGTKNSVPLGAGVTEQGFLVYPPTSEVIDREGDVKIWPATRDQYDSSQGVPTAGIEFDSDETVDHFTTKWWAAFRSAVNAFGTDEGRSVDCYNGNPEACTSTSALFQMISGKFAIVTGLLGMDTAHGIYPELHPAFAMAIRVNDDPADETWEFFVRRSGDQGWCSSSLVLLDNLPNDTYTFRLPSRGTAVQVTSEEWATANGQVARSFPSSIDPSQGKLVSFSLPISDMIHGEIHLRWSGGAPAPVAKLSGSGSIHVGATKSPGNQPRMAARPSAEEEGVGALVATMTSAQKQLFLTKLKPKAAPVMHNKAPRSAPPTLPAGTAGNKRLAPPTTRLVPNPVKREADQKLVEALHAVYGPKLDQNLPARPATP